MQDLTDRQANVLMEICRYRRLRGVSPSIREIAQACGGSIAHVQAVVGALDRKGFIGQGLGVRNIHVTSQGQGEFEARENLTGAEFAPPSPCGPDARALRHAVVDYLEACDTFVRIGQDNKDLRQRQARRVKVCRDEMRRLVATG